MHIDEYEKQQPVYELFAKTVARILTAAIDHAGDYRLQVVRARAKEAGSLRRKLINRGIDQSTRIEHEIKDLAGCRAILYTNGDVEKLINSGLIESNFDVVERKIHHSGIDPRTSPQLYTANHYVVRLGSDRLTLPEYVQFAGMRCEIQLQTILNHAWAEIEHDIYKAPELSPNFGTTALNSINERLHGIAVKYLLPAGYEFDKATRDLDRLEQGKELFDRNALAAITQASDNNVRYDALQSFADHVLPLYDDLPSEWAGVMNVLLAAVDQARDAEVVPIEGPFGFFPGKSFENIARLIVDKIRPYRFLDIPRSLELAGQLHRLAGSPEEGPALELAHAVAKHDLEAWHEVGPAIQRVVVDYICRLAAEHPPLDTTLWVPVLEDVLDSEASSARAVSSSSVAIGQGVVAGSSALASIRDDALNCLQQQFAQTTDARRRARLVAAMAHGAQPPYRGASSPELTKILISNALRFTRFATSIVDDVALELVRTLENRVHRMFTWFGVLRPDLAGNQELQELAAEFQEATTAFRATLKAVPEFETYKILVGFDSTFAWDWEGNKRGYSEVEQYRAEQAALMLSTVTPENFNEWSGRLDRFAQTESSDLAMFPIFGQFLEDLALRFPKQTLTSLERIEGRFGEFLVRLLKGLLRSDQAAAARAVMDRWVKHGKHLAQLSWLVVAKGDLPVEFIHAVLRSAITHADAYSVKSVVRGLAFNYKEFHDQSEERHALLLDALDYLVSKGNFTWFRMGWFSWRHSHEILDALDELSVQRMFSWIMRSPDLPEGASEFVAALVKHRPLLLLAFLDERAQLARADEIAGFVVIPYDLSDALGPLRKIPNEVLAAVRRWFEADDQSLEYSTERAIQEAFDGVTPDLRAELERLLASGTRDDTLFALAVLKSFQSESEVFDVARQAAAAWGEDEEIVDDIYWAIAQEGGTSGVFGRVKAIQAKRALLAAWLTDDREGVRKFAEMHLPLFDHRIAEETRRAQASNAARRLAFDEPPLSDEPAEPTGD
ncbi:GTP pyrophosphokinase [Pseudoxanthomonas wuyuanensis]